MSGPFDQSTTEEILRGPFYCSPFIVSEQDQGPLLPPKFRVCRNLSRGDPKMNIGSVKSFISKHNFPTRFDMATRVAEAVSFIPTFTGAVTRSFICCRPGWGLLSYADAALRADNHVPTQPCGYQAPTQLCGCDHRADAALRASFTPTQLCGCGHYADAALRALSPGSSTQLCGCIMPTQLCGLSVHRRS